VVVYYAAHWLPVCLQWHFSGQSTLAVMHVDRGWTQQTALMQY
jgi:hypothetical protein